MINTVNRYLTKIFEKPTHRWGWVRLIAYTMLGGVVVWTFACAMLRGFGDVSWMMWSGYQRFLPVNGLGLAVIPLLAGVIGGWLEEHERQQETALANHREAEQARALHRQAVIEQFRQAVQVVLPEATLDAPEMPLETQRKIAGMVRATLRELDGKGKGEMLAFLSEHNLLCGEKPVVEFHDADFGGVILTQAQLSEVCMEGVDLSRAQMDGANLARGRLSRATLRRAFLRQADLREAVLSSSNLREAHLEGANLEGADLRLAWLEGAFFINANLKNCHVDHFHPVGDDPAKAGKKVDRGGLGGLDKAILVDTILPDGRKATNEKGRAYLREKEFAMLVDKL